MERVRERRRRIEDEARFRFVDTARTRVTEVDVILTGWRRWEARPESTSPAWNARRIGPLVLALRVLG